LRRRFVKQTPKPQKRIFVNHQIKAREVRVVDREGKQLGVFKLEDALKKAQEAGLDLIQVTEKVEPPVCKIMDYGKYLYQQKKKEKKTKTQKAGELKNIRLGFNISDHDLKTKAKTAQEFLKKGHKIRIEMVLRGREKRLADFGKEKINQFLEILKESIPLQVERELKKEPRGLTMIVSRSQKA